MPHTDKILQNIWAATQQNQQNYLCTQRRLISLGIRTVWSVFAVCMKHWVLSYPLRAQQRPTDAQDDLNSRWADIILLVLSCTGSFTHVEFVCVAYKLLKYVLSFLGKTRSKIFCPFCATDCCFIGTGQNQSPPDVKFAIHSEARTGLDNLTNIQSSDTWEPWWESGETCWQVRKECILAFYRPSFGHQT